MLAGNYSLLVAHPPTVLPPNYGGAGPLVIYPVCTTFSPLVWLTNTFLSVVFSHDLGFGQTLVSASRLHRPKRAVRVTRDVMIGIREKLEISTTTVHFFSTKVFQLFNTMAKFSISKDAKELSIPIDKPRTLDHFEESNNLNKESLYP
ncbi:hypothetical protein QTP88_006962 [Uroleucon formosanum]